MLFRERQERHEKEFLRKVHNAIQLSLNQMGRIVLSNLQHETPVRTGMLKSNNRYEVKGSSVWIINQTPYAKFVEFGTYKMHANPFVRRSIAKSKKAIIDLIMKNLGAR